MSGTFSLFDFDPPAPAQLSGLLQGYEVLAFIGKGTLGTIYKASQPHLDRLVALKILPSGGQGNRQLVERFQREAQAMARMRHDNIMTVHDFGETTDGALLFIAMEWVDGNTLERALIQENFDQARALDVIDQFCDALRYAHDHGIVHRDIKPANTMLDVAGIIKIADFGLATVIGPDTFSTMLTHTSASIGSRDFVAPEQFEPGRAIDHRVDIYSVGVILYKMLTGLIPRGTFIPPSGHANLIDPRLDDVVAKALQADPDDRYQDITALRDALAEIRAAPREPAPAPAPHQPQLITGAVHEKASAPRLITGRVDEKAPRQHLITGRVPQKAESVPEAIPLPDPDGQSAAATAKPIVSEKAPIAIFVVAGTLAIVIAATAAGILLLDKNSSSGSGEDTPGLVSRPPTASASASATAPKPRPKSAPPRSEPAPPEAPQVAEFVLPGQAVDLLRLARVKSDTVSGDWSRDGASLHASLQESHSRFMFPALGSSGGYDFRADFTRLDGNGTVGFHLPVGAHSVMLLLHHPPGNRSAALAQVDGVDAGDAKNPARASNVSIENGKRYEIEVEVRLLENDEASLRARLDGNPLIDWTGKRASLEPWSGWTMPMPDALGVAVQKATVNFDRAEVEAADGMLALLRFQPLDLERPSAAGELVVWARTGPEDTAAALLGAPPEGLDGVVAITAPDNTGNGILALQQNGAIVPWFDKSDPADKTIVFTGIPRSIGDVVAISAGGRHALALLSDGSVVAWGAGPAAKVPRGLSGVVAIAAGSSHSLALRKDGTVTAWGGNNFNQLEMPEGLTDVIAIAAGGAHLLALKKDGTCVAWGRNDHGQCDVPGNLGRITKIAAVAEDSYWFTGDGRLEHRGQVEDVIPATLENIEQFFVSRAILATRNREGAWQFHGKNLDAARAATRAVDCTAFAAAPKLVFALGARPEETLAAAPRTAAAVSKELPGQSAAATASPPEIAAAPANAANPADPAAMADPPATPGAADESDPSLSIPETRISKITARFEKRYQDSIAIEFNAGLKTLNQQYLGALERAHRIATDRGDLDEVLRLNKEVEAVNAAPGRPLALEPGADDPASLQNLHSTYLGQMTQLEEEREKSSIPLKNAYDQALESLENEFTRELKVEAALVVRRAREKLASEGLPFLTDTPRAEANLTGPEPPPTDPQAASGATGSSPSFAADLPANAIKVTPDGAGETLTLDEALEQAQNNPVLALAAGEYDPIVIETQGLTLLGNRSFVFGIVIHASDIAMKGLKMNSLWVGEWASGDGQTKIVDITGIHMENCNFGRLETTDNCALEAVNCMGSIHLHYGTKAVFRHCTFVSPGTQDFQGHVLSSNTESEFTNCVFSGGPYLLFTHAPGPKDCQIRRSVVHVADQFLAVRNDPEPPSKQPTIVTANDRRARRDYAFNLSGCIFEDPQFENPGGGDYRLKDTSPGKGKAAPGGRDFGANLDADGWPVAP